MRAATIQWSKGSMDRNYIIGLLLIAVIFVGWFLYVGQNMPERKPLVESDSLAMGYEDTLVELDVEPTRIEREQSQSGGSALDSLIAVSDSIPEEIITVQTELYSAKLSTRGGGITSFVLRNYDYLDNGGIEMVKSDGVAVPNFRFDRGRFDLRQLNFTVDRRSLELTGQSSDRISFSFQFPSGETIKKTYIFYADKYAFDIEFELDGINSLGFSDYYEVFFEPGLESTEKNVKDDLANFKAYALLGGDVEKFDDFDDRGQIHEDLSGITEWISTRSKYFTAIMIPTSRDANGLSVSGSKAKPDEKRGIRGYSHIGVALKMQLAQRDNLFDAYTVYLGPLEYDRLRAFDLDLENTLNLGMSVIRPVSRFVTWLMIRFHKVIPNYGVVIVLFSILMKLVFSPLSYKSMKSMRKMQEIMPRQNEIREKYKKDPQRMQQEIMKLYKTEKINPMSGCLPMLPQIPVFWALFTVFRYTIELRGAPFMLWMQDLSQPDPIYILPVLMAVSMFVQQKITVKDPKQKMMIYLFPGLFLFWGISFPSGLCLYWSITNILSLFEAVFVHKRHLPVASQPVTDVQPSKKSKK
jgi:YidC/Oxa1 family membrane protein insertase